MRHMMFVVVILFVVVVGTSTVQANAVFDGTIDAGSLIVDQNSGGDDPPPSPPKKRTWDQIKAIYR